jgi:diguanylate cyclase (GGDEF)-like protein
MLAEIEEREETLKERQKHLQQLAHFDNLTQLPNRVLYSDRLLQSILQAQRTEQKVAIRFIDLDHFKDINDSVGHRIGDLLLKDVAARLLSIVRISDTVARMGGDEFTILLPNISHRDNANTVADKIVKHLSQPYQLESEELYISASVGVAIFPDDGITVDELLKNADTAMYQAKSNGKNMYRFYSLDMLAIAKNRITIMNNLHHAIERNELILHYQPKMNMARDRMVGAEALMRWQHPEMGIIPPDRFIPLAEETGLIIPMGEWALRRVCLQIREWQEQGYSPCIIAVNVSPIQFKRHNFFETVRDIIDETGIDPSLLELEVTESTIMQDMGSTIKTLRALKDLGIAISIDDFGTGYSSLSNLKRFPIDTLKIDKSFIVNIANNVDDKAIVSAIISMAKSLGLNIIAEGVETEAQLSFLSEQGCNEIQGYLFSKPLPAELLIQFMCKQGSTRSLSDLTIVSLASLVNLT